MTLPAWLTDDEPEGLLPWHTPSLVRKHDDGTVSTVAPQLDVTSADHMDWLGQFVAHVAPEQARGLPKSADELKDDGRTWFVASTDKEARDGNIWEQQWRLADYRRNPVFLAEHRGSQVIGRGTAKVVRGDENGLLLGVEWHRSELNPLALLIAEQHETRFRHACSVRQLPGQVINRSKLPSDDPRYQDAPSWRAGLIFRFPVLIEGSSVGVPSDARAIQIRGYVAEAEDPAEQLARLLRETAGPTARSVLLAAVRDQPELRRALLGTIPLGTTPAHPPAVKLPAFLEG